MYLQFSIVQKILNTRSCYLISMKNLPPCMLLEVGYLILLSSKIHCDTVTFNKLSGEATKNVGRTTINNPVAFATSSHRSVIPSCVIDSSNNIIVGARMTISGSDKVVVSYLIMSK